MPQRLPTRHTDPRAYGREKAPMILRRWSDPTLRAAVERYGPRYLPGMPALAVLALGASSTGATEDLQGIAVGLWGVERRYIDQWANDAETVDVMGRSYSPDRYGTDLEAQAFTGCRRYAKAVADARARISALVGRAGAVDATTASAAVSCYSAGPGVLASIVAEVPGLDAVEKRARWAALARHVVSRGQSGRIGGRSVSHPYGAAWALARPLERYWSGRIAAQSAGVDLAWWDLADVPDAATLSVWAHTPA